VAALRYLAVLGGTRVKPSAVATAVAIAVGVLMLLPPVTAAPHSADAGAARHLVAADYARFSAGLVRHGLPSGEPIEVTVSLEPRNAAGLLALDSALARSGGTSFLTEAAFQKAFSPSDSNVSRLEHYFVGYGAGRFALTPDHLALRFALPIGGAEQAFSTSLVGGNEVGGASWSWTTPPSLPSELAGSVYGVGGLSRVPFVPRVSAHVSPLLSRSGSVGSYVIDGNATNVNWFTGSDYVQAYGETALFPGGTGAGSNSTFATGRAVATLLMSGYNSTAQTDLPPWDPAQIFDYFNDTSPASWPRPNYIGVPVTIAGRTPPAPGPFGALTDDSLDEPENSLDIEMAGSSAPGATVANFYFSASLFQNLSGSAPLGPIADDFAQTLSQALSYNYTTSRLSSISNSYGLPDLNDSLWNLELAHAAATGVTVVAASGDQGNAPSDISGRFQGQWPTWPASAAFENYGVVSVGGASLALNGPATGTYSGGTLPDQFDSNITGIGSQVAWYNALGGFGHVEGTEGGLSTVIPEPTWQFHSAAQPAISVAGGIQGSTLLGRAGPDVAFPANDTIAYIAHNATGSFFTVLEGTSVAAPYFAGLLAEWSAVANHSFGWLDPALYRMAGYYAANPSSASPFLDITAGNNFQFQAAAGWDPTTGWGGLDPVRFLPAYANPSVRGFNYTGPTPGLPPGLFNPAPVTPIVTFVVVALGIGLALALVAIVVWDERRRHRLPPGGQYQVPPWTYGNPPAAPPPVGTWAPLPASEYPSPPGAVPHGGSAPWPPQWSGPSAPASFSCPYCGTPRPAEPVRCPGCGAF
jgi:subtilase family serine protease